ncbi:MAG: cytoplasmic protein [Deltaproteobacteria bacterium]|nr:cytoplasmic protein [Deltaproteobacteria bacterium]
MLKNDLITRNPLRLMGHESEDILAQGEFGALLARAGVGKTALLVQLSLNSLLQGKNVLHISLQDPVKKVSLWYREVFSRISQQYDINQINQLWDSVLPHRFIMTFRVEGFTTPKLEERLTDLLEQDIFIPRMMLIDGLPFDENAQAPLKELKSLARKYGLHAWFTVRTHRHEDPGPGGVPVQLQQVDDLFEVAIQLVPEGKQVHVKTLKGIGAASGQLDLVLDPATMLIQNR